MSASLPFSSSSNSLTDVYAELHRRIQPVALSWKTLTSFTLITKQWNVLTAIDFSVKPTRLMLSALWYVWSCKVLGIAVEINERRGVEPPRSPLIQEDAGGKCLQTERMRSVERRWNCSRIFAQRGKCKAIIVRISYIISAILQDLELSQVTRTYLLHIISVFLFL